MKYTATGRDDENEENIEVILNGILFYTDGYKVTIENEFEVYGTNRPASK